ncbi:MAG: limonene-1,2-epoxide hydrolase family protein [Rugosibacter sp.]|jgi:limonene-1,2-epoxide hydrolase|nr:limonene-1,2-epoxide hydrolase family protein [Rugosibacter sp.]
MQSTLEQRNIDIVRNFCADWSKCSNQVLLPYFTEDAIYHNMPWAPLKGHQAIGDFLAPFWSMLDSITFDVLNIAANGAVIFTERVDYFRFKNGGKLDLPVNGVFELNAEGKITQWREYWDLADWIKQGGPTA